MGKIYILLGEVAERGAMTIHQVPALRPACPARHGAAATGIGTSEPGVGDHGGGDRRVPKVPTISRLNSIPSHPETLSPFSLTVPS
jgi:hypothetical protein